jgi:hypothetical protein
MREFDPLFTLIGPFYIIFLVAFYIFYFKRSRVRLVRKRFFRALKENIQAGGNLASQEKQLNLIYKKLSENFSFVSSQMRGLTDLLEDFIYFFDARGPEMLKDNYSVEVDRALRDSSYALLSHIREANPFSTLPPKEANLLRTLKQALDNSNRDLGITTVRQLAEEIEVLDSSIRAGERRTRISYVISIVGVVLTVVFGFVSFFQFFVK